MTSALKAAATFMEVQGLQWLFGLTVLLVLAILVLVLSINLFGEGLRDILDPRLKVE